MFLFISVCQNLISKEGIQLRFTCFKLQSQLAILCLKKGTLVHLKSPGRVWTHKEAEKVVEKLVANGQGFPLTCVML